MKLISSGYQYDVFDLGNGSVLKKEVGPIYRLKKMFAGFRQEGHGRIASLRKAVASNAESVHITLAIKNRLTPELSALLGNPRFKEGISYEQDKLTMVEDYLAAHSLEENKALVDKYIDLRQKLWRHGIHDYVFKFKGNHAVTRNGEVALIDFNEVHLTKERALESLRGKKWLTLPQYRKWPEGELKDYYTRAMERAMTEENLDRHWAA